MTEYIERRVTLNMIGNIDTSHPYDDMDDIVEKALAVVDLIPAADVAPVVHCRDCVYNGLDSMPHTKDKCYRLMLTCFKVKPEDFCAWGRKKDGE